MKRKPAKSLLYIAVISIVVVVAILFNVQNSYSFRIPFSVAKLSKDYTIQGIDISHHQGEINWNKVKQAKIQNHPISFAIIKATEGGDFTDHRFHYNWKELNKVGLTKGAYHFYRPKTDPNIQAKNYIKNVKLKKGDLPRSAQAIA
jgi:lysozyme